jgi:hypothetical protein
MDGFGNSWLVDLNGASKEWGPIFFVCHDPPVVQFQCATFEQFLTELFKQFQPPYESETTRVRDEGMVIWKSNPHVMDFDEAVARRDDLVPRFARELGKEWQFIDLRNVPSGSGFSWGRYGPETEVRRFGDEPIFAYRKPEAKSFLSGLFGKKN